MLIYAINVAEINAEKYFSVANGRLFTSSPGSKVDRRKETAASCIQLS